MEIIFRRTGQKQTAYQIVVSKNKEFSDIAWDTGKVLSSETFGIKYNGLDLTSSTRYYWKVTIWDKNDKPITSDVAYFETALLENNAWDDAEWIQIDRSSPSLHYTVEADITIQNTAASLLFNIASTNNLYMWQFNTSNGYVMLKPHSRIGGTYKAYSAHMKDVSAYTGDANSVKTKAFHVTIDVNANEIKTYINNVLVDTFAYTEFDSGAPSLMLSPIGIRASSSEEAKIDNYKLVDYTNNKDGSVIYDFNFNDGQNPFTAGSVSSGVLICSGVFNEGYLKDNYKSLTDIRSASFRKEFVLDNGKQLKSAKLYASALGAFDVFIDGNRVGNRLEDGSIIYDELKPGTTEFNKRKFYLSYDITYLLENPGNHVISATVTNGWWRGDIAINRGVNYAFIAKIILFYTDGSRQVINTDTTWKAKEIGPVVYGDIYNGEIYDARVSTGWRLPGYDASTWDNAAVNNEFNGTLSAYMGTPIRVREDLQLKPVNIYVYNSITGANETEYGKVKITNTYTDGTAFTLKKGETLIVDFGQNFAGWPEITMSGNAGTTVTIRHAEALNDQNGSKSRNNDGPEGSIYTANLRSAQAKAVYTMSGSGTETYHSTHTYYGFRYIEITATDDITFYSARGLVLTSVAEETGTNNTSDDSVNQLIKNALWGQYSNYLGTPTDCPQRNERVGWTGDTQVFAGTAAYNASSYAFLRKWMQDLRDSQAANGAYIAAAPSGPNGQGYGVAGWADAGIIVPYTMWKMYGDTTIIKENYESMQAYIVINTLHQPIKTAAH